MNEGYAGERMMAKGAPSVTRQSTAAEVAQIGQVLSKRAQELAERLEERLRPVMSVPTPRVCEDSAKEARQFPPLFSDLRSTFGLIKDALDSIENAIQRTEL